jgi:methylenetetrahydrofolate dehydrogenase (NADP+)/methenyltetrahydrofolate cyclohydrolase
MLLDRKNATVTMCNSRTRNLPELCREAEVLVVAMGKRGAIGADCFRPGQIAVDVGIHVNEEGKLCGDVRTDEAMDIAAAVTPVPGGVGAVTTAVLVSHVVRSAQRRCAPEVDA